jgi:hypothetical protein
VCVWRPKNSPLGTKVVARAVFTACWNFWGSGLRCREATSPILGATCSRHAHLGASGRSKIMCRWYRTRSTTH